MTFSHPRLRRFVRHVLFWLGLHPTVAGRAKAERVSRERGSWEAKR